MRDKSLHQLNHSLGIILSLKFAVPDWRLHSQRFICYDWPDAEQR
jgi:hypothetical protein